MVFIGVKNFNMAYRDLLSRWLLPALFYAAYLAIQVAADPPKIITKDREDLEREHEKVVRYKVASVDYGHVEKPFMLTIWVLLASFAKIGFHLSPRPSSYIPESCMLIMLGVLTGIILFFSQVGHLEYTLSTSVFFLFLLPPIVLEAGYFMPRRPFFENIGTILLLAVVGTLWNTLSMGFALWGISKAGLYGVDIPLLHCLLFSALISAVDPVAILAVFEEAQVNEILHIVVFGESLLNDGVAVVLYNMFGTYSKIGAENIISSDIVNGVLSFFVVALGGTLIGCLFAFFTGWLTKYTEKVTVIEPLFVFLMAYMSYLVGDMFKLSGILAIVFCGMIMRKYVEANISPKSTTTVKYTMKMLSSTCESIIFLFLGLSTVVDTHVWNTAFTLFSIFFSILFRAIGILVMIPLLNRHRLVKMNKVDIFVMIYGGLRGAISFSLAMLLDDTAIGLTTKHMFVTTTVTIVIFTSFFQGLSIRPLVEILRVKKAGAKDKNMGEILFERCFDHLLVGIEDLIGARGRNRIRDQFEVFETKYFKPLLMKHMPVRENKLLQVCTKLNLKEANEFIQQHGDIKNMKKDLSMVEGASFGEMPVVDTSHLDPVYSNREEADRWHYMMEDIMYQPRQKVKKYSRHMLFENPPHASLTTTPPNRHTSRHKATRPLLEHSKKREKLVKNGSIISKVSGSGRSSRYSGITGALRRLSLSITSPTHGAGTGRQKPSPKGDRGREDSTGGEGIFFAATPLRTVNGGGPPRGATSPTTSSDAMSFTNLSIAPPNAASSPTGSNKRVNFELPPVKDTNAPVKKAAEKLKDISKTYGAKAGDESIRLINDDTTDSSLSESPPIQKPLTSQSNQPLSPRPSVAPPPSLPPIPENVSNPKLPILKDSEKQKTAAPPAPTVKPDHESKPSKQNLIDIDDDTTKPTPHPPDKVSKAEPQKARETTGQPAQPESVDDKTPGAEEEPQSRKGSLTIAEKALPWKTPSPHPQKMPNPPRKLSDAYANAPAHLPSILDQNPKPPATHKEVLMAQGKLAKDESLSSPTTDSQSFFSATPSAQSPDNDKMQDASSQFDLTDPEATLEAGHEIRDKEIIGEESSDADMDKLPSDVGAVPAHTFKLPSGSLLSPDEDKLDKDIL